jgi:hypothetical protein
MNSSAQLNCRARAEQCRRLAENAPSRGTHASFLELAQCYEALAALGRLGIASALGCSDCRGSSTSRRFPEGG